MMLKQKRIRSESHRRFIASLPCAVTGLEGTTQCAHVSKGRYSMGMKSSDDYCIPLSIAEHLKQHSEGEFRYYYGKKGYERAIVLAKALYACTGNDIEGKRLITEWRLSWNAKEDVLGQ